MKKILFLISLVLFSSLAFANEKVLFIHVPKTAGLSLRALIQEQYAKTDPENKTRRRRNSNKDFVCGHMLYSSVSSKFADYKRITFLRDPIERVLSEQRFCVEKCRRNPRILKCHFLPTVGDPIDTASNVACKMLSTLNPNDESISIQDHLESAKYALENEFWFVGFTEKLDESVELLFKSLDWNLNTKIPNINTTKKTKSYDQSILDGIAERNWADIELYNFALDLYERNKQKILSS